MSLPESRAAIGTLFWRRLRSARSSARTATGVAQRVGPATREPSSPKVIQRHACFPSRDSSTRVERAGDRYRSGVSSLEDWGSAIELRPQRSEILRGTLDGLADRSGRPDSNRRPQRPKRCALTKLRYAPNRSILAPKSRLSWSGAIERGRVPGPRLVPTGRGSAAFARVKSGRPKMSRTSNRLSSSLGVTGRHPHFRPPSAVRGSQPASPDIRRRYDRVPAPGLRCRVTPST